MRCNYPECYPCSPGCKAHPEWCTVCGAELLEQRKSGRWRGGDVEVPFDEEWGFPSAIYAKYIDKYGDSNGVYITPAIAMLPEPPTAKQQKARSVKPVERERGLTRSAKMRKRGGWWRELWRVAMLLVSPSS